MKYILALMSFSTLTFACQPLLGAKVNPEVVEAPLYLLEETWSLYTDSEYNGTSSWSCNGSESNKEGCYNEGSLEVEFNVTDEAHLENGTDYFGYTGLILKYEEIVEGVKVPMNLEEYSEGIYIEYESTQAMWLTVITSSKENNGNHHTVKLSRLSKSKYFKWSDFKIPSWWSGSKWDLNLSDIKEFRIEAHSANVSGTSNFKLHKFELQGVCNNNYEHPATEGKPVPIFGGATGLNFEYNLVGENLVFSNLTSTVEIFDLQGKRVASGEVSSSANSISLEGLKNASYVVRTTAGQFLISIVK